MSSKKLSGGQLRNFRSQVAKLKSLGLVSARVDARAQKPTRYMRKQVETYGDVLAGRAKVVKAKSRSAAKAAAGEQFRQKGRAVVVPVQNKADRVRLTKSGEIRSYGTENGRKVTRVLRTRQLDLYDRSTYPRGTGILYRMPFGKGPKAYRISFDDVDELFAFMFQYESDPKNPYNDWQKFVEIVYLDDSDNDLDLAA